MNACFFIGHANTANDVFPKLLAAIEHEITRSGISEFYVGNHGQFDALVIHALREAKQKHQHIRCFLVSAYHPATVKLETPSGFDGIFYPHMQSIPPRFALPRTNRAMVDQCAVLIAAVKYPSRSRDVLEYAQRREKRGMIRVINLHAKRQENA